MWLPVIAVCIWSLGEHVRPVDSAHFMGGLIYWRPVNPGEFDGRVQVTHRVTLRGTTCTVSTATLGSRQLACQIGCSSVNAIGSSTFSCTDFGVLDGWSTGEGTYYYNFDNTTHHPYFEAVYSGGNWLRSLGDGDWEFRVKGNLNCREDTGVINSSPVVNIPPLIRLQQGCSHTIKIPVEDADGDHVRCRWAESSLSECGEVCRTFPANLNGRNCEIHYTGSYLATGDYAVALQVEDFMSLTDTTPLSSVPVQFVVRVRSFLSSLCTSRPELVGNTPLNGSNFKVPINTSWSATITARVSGSSTATSITEFITASPLGMRKSNLTQCDNPREWQIDITWTPTESQLGPNIFCYIAMDNIGLQSTQRCVILIAYMDPESPMIVPDSMSPTGKIFSNQSLWSMSIQFDKQFTRPARDTYIRIFGEEGDEVVTINARTSAAVTYPMDTSHAGQAGSGDYMGTVNRTLIFDVNICQLPINHTFYILLDAGVAVGTEFCHAESLPMTDPTLWTFLTTEHTDTYTTNFTNIDYTTMHTTEFVPAKHTKTLDIATESMTAEHTETSENTEMIEFVTSTSGLTDTHGKVSDTIVTTPSSNTESKSESREVTSVCLANSIVITVCVMLSLTFLFGVICGLITERCVCALLKRKAKQQTSLKTLEKSDKAAQDHYEMDESEARAHTSVVDIYDEITPHCKLGVVNTSWGGTQ